MMSKISAVSAGVFAFAACAATSAEERVDFGEDRIGRIYYYERTNSDGTNDERVTVFRRSADRIEVYKEASLCENAALVTADLDLDTASATSFVGGRLLPEAKVAEFAYLDWDQDAEQLNLLVKLPEAEIRDEAPIPASPWHLYDFDLASLTVMTPRTVEPRTDFSFGMALLWADPSAGDPLTFMGDVEAAYAADESRLGFEAQRYELSGSAFSGERATGAQGELWLDANDGHIVDAVFPAPNHPGYTDFRLRLLKVSDGGEAEWTALLKRHFEGCEA